MGHQGGEECGEEAVVAIYVDDFLTGGPKVVEEELTKRQGQAVDGVCRKGKACGFSHEWGEEGKMGRCWNCGSTQHMKPDCPVKEQQNPRVRKEVKPESESGSIGSSTDRTLSCCHLAIWELVHHTLRLKSTSRSASKSASSGAPLNPPPRAPGNPPPENTRKSTSRRARKSASRSTRKCASLAL